MNKMILSGVFSLILTMTMFAQQGRTPVPSSEKAKKTVDRISDKVSFSKQQNADLIIIYTKFFDDVNVQRAWNDQTKLGPIEKERDAKVSKKLNNPKLFKEYQDVVRQMKAEYLVRQKEKGKK